MKRVKFAQDKFTHEGVPQWLPELGTLNGGFPSFSPLKLPPSSPQKLQTVARRHIEKRTPTLMFQTSRDHLKSRERSLHPMRTLIQSRQLDSLLFFLLL